MSDILRGMVKDIIDGDTFELQVTNVSADDPERYDAVERVQINILSSEMEATETEDGGDVETDTEEMDGRDGGEREVELGAAANTMYSNVRDAEDLEESIKGKEVICEIKERTPSSLLLANVTVI